MLFFRFSNSENVEVLLDTTQTPIYFSSHLYLSSTVPKFIFLLEIFWRIPTSWENIAQISHYGSTELLLLSF